MDPPNMPTTGLVRLGGEGGPLPQAIVCCRDEGGELAVTSSTFETLLAGW
jgi:hypothetical protein